MHIVIRRMLALFAVCFIAGTGQAIAGDTRAFWTEITSANLTTVINVINHGAATITVTATFFADDGTPLGNAEKLVAPNGRWNFSTGNIGNATLETVFSNRQRGSLLVSSSGATQSFGSYATTYKTSTISGFNFSLAQPSPYTPSCRGNSYTLASTDTGTTDTAAGCSTEDLNKFAYDLMKGIYLWYDQTPDIDHTAYASPSEVMTAMRYEARDKWSYITNKATFNSFFSEGQYVGMGFGYQLHTDGNAYITTVYADSPADQAGIKRGYKIKQVNCVTEDEITANGLWGVITGNNEVGVTVDMVFEDENGAELATTLTKAVVTINTVYHTEVLDIDGAKVGYLVFTNFLATSTTPLDAAFDTFKSAGVTDLILDLRYNGGGRISVAEYLSSLVNSADTSGSVVLKMAHNDVYAPNLDTSTFFASQTNSLNLSRLFVITTALTCSASEIVINALKPFISLIQVGHLTCGKPVGSYAFEKCDKSANPIAFENLNADSEGRYYDGIATTCAAEDTPTKQFGDTAEASLAEAIYYIRNGTCSPEKPDAQKPPPPTSPLTGFQRVIGAI